MQSRPWDCNFGSSFSSNTIFPQLSMRCMSVVYGGPGSTPSNKYGWLQHFRSCRINKMQSINQSIDQPNNHSKIRSINQSINQSIHQKMIRIPSWSINQSIDDQIDQHMKKQSINQSINRSNLFFDKGCWIWKCRPLPAWECSATGLSPLWRCWGRSNPSSATSYTNLVGFC